MKNVLSVGATFCLLAAPSVNAALVNGDFEAGNFSSWAVFYATPASISISTFTHAGNYSAQFTAIQPMTESGCSLDQSASLVVGQEYQYSAWVYTGGSTTGYAYLQESPVLSYPGMETLAFATMGVAQWQFVSETFVATTSSPWLRLIFDGGDGWYNPAYPSSTVQAGATVYFDDVSLTQVTGLPETPTTLTKYYTPPNPAPEPNTMLCGAATCVLVLLGCRKARRQVRMEPDHRRGSV